MDKSASAELSGIPDLRQSFDALPTPVPSSGSGMRFSASPIAQHPTHRCAKDVEGQPAILISVAGPRPQGWPPPIVLEHLSVQYDVACRIVDPDGTTLNENFTVVRCTTSDTALWSYFLRVGSTIITLLGHRPSTAEVETAMNHVVELFRSMQATPRKSVQGLWAELLLITRTRNPSAMTRAWHALPSDRYDFSAGSQRVEVKSASGRRRHHSFALDQLSPPLAAQVLVVSVLVERAGGGASLTELLHEVRSAVAADPKLALHVDQIVARTLGNEWRESQVERFDRELAENSVAFFNCAAIPTVDPLLPPGVSDVHFRVDLSAIPEIDPDVYRARGGIFYEALSARRRRGTARDHPVTDFEVFETRTGDPTTPSR